MQAYRRLEKRFERISRLKDALGILGWDKETTMPLGAAAARGETVATLSVMAHELITCGETGELLDRAGEEAGGLGPWQAANLREMRRQHAHATAVPADLVEAASRAATACELVWRQARQDGTFAAVLPGLEEVLRTQRAIGQSKGAALGLDSYDALLDQYDPGTTQRFVDPVFEQVGSALPGLIAAALEQQARHPAPLPMKGPFPVAAQRALGQKLMGVVGFDAERGRLDISAHPFCGGATDDVRITTRYDEADFTGALMGVLHETGHALYEQGRPADFLFQPVGEARGMTLHESQSLLVEMQVCRGDAFLRFLSPLLREAFGDDPGLSASNLAAGLRRVRPSFIRVEADEVTYPAHVILRYRLERAMINGDLSLQDLPGAFNDGIEASIGVRVQDDRLGCLQDIHWYAGLWGYFPTYTLGAIAAAQLMGAARRSLPDLDRRIGEGDFAGLAGWLKAAVHARGSVAPSTTIIEQATGAPLDAGLYLDHLRSRYLAA